MDSADRIKQARTELALSVRAMGDALGVSGSVITGWEGGADVRKPNALAIEHLWGLSWRWLLEGEGPMWVSRAEGFTLPLYRGLPVFEADGSMRSTFEGACPFWQTLAEQLVLLSSGSELGVTTRDLALYFDLECDTCSPTIQHDDIICVCQHPAVRRQPSPRRIHLVREYETGPATLRRVVVHERSNTLMMLADSEWEAPLTLDLEGLKLEDIILGQVIWQGRELTDNVSRQPSINRPNSRVDEEMVRRAEVTRAAYDARGAEIEALRARLADLEKPPKPNTHGILMPQIGKAKKP